MSGTFFRAIEVNSPQLTKHRLGDEKGETREMQAYLSLGWPLHEKGASIDLGME